MSRRQTGGAILSTRNYRVILKNGQYAIHEVYYGEDGEPWTCSEEPAFPSGETLDELREDLVLYRFALEHAVLVCADLVPDHEPPEPDMEQPF